MKIISALVHDGVIYKTGDYIKLVLDNGSHVKGKIRFFGDVTDGKFQIAPTEDFFIDYVLESEYSVRCGEFGKTRHLSSLELEKYKCIFSEIIPGGLIDDENVRVVEYCWYNATECESYFDETDDDFYDEV